MSIVVPPYIRFQQGILMIRKAHLLLYRVEDVARSGHKVLSEIYEQLDQSPDTKALGLSYETLFASQLTINLASEVENVFTSAVGAALRLHPGKMGSQTFTLSDVLSSTSRDELVERAASTVLNSIMYEKPKAYLKRFAALLSVDAEKLQAHWPAFVEMKARRDLGIHNNWIVNEVYLRKLREAGLESPNSAGDRVVPNFSYLIRATEACENLVDALTDLLAEKWIPTRSNSESQAGRQET